jgi:hypothetical protein
MDITRLAACSTPKFLRGLFLSVFVMSSAAIVAWSRRTISRSGSAANWPSEPSELNYSSIQQPAAQPTRRSPWMMGAHWLLFGVIVILLAWLLVNVPRPRLAMSFVIVAAIVINRPRILAAAAIGLMIECALIFQSTPEIGELAVPTIQLLLAGFTFWMSMHLEWKDTRIPALPTLGARAPASVRLSQAHIGIFFLGLIALGELIRINAVPHVETVSLPVSIDMQVALLVTAIILIVIGLGHIRLPRCVPTIHWPTVLLVMGMIGLALAVRFWQLGERNRFFIDELFFADNIGLLRTWRNVSLLAPFDGVAAEPLLFPYWQSLTVAVFGRTLFGLRAASAIIGALTIGGMYVLGRILFDRKTALLAALLLATFPPHIHFSRIGLSEIAMTWFGTLALAFLARGVIHQRQFDFAVGGVMLGMTHYFHEGGKYLYTPLAAIWLLGVWALNWPRLSLKQLGLAGLACLLVALPIYTTLLATQKPLAARMVANEAGLSGEYWQQLFQSGNLWQHVFDHVLPPFLIYIQRWDLSLFYGGETPLVLGFLTPGLLLGAFYVLRRWNSPGPLLLILWVLATSLGNSLLVESAGAPRFVVVFPGLMLLAAVGIRYSLPLIWPDELNGSVPAALRRVYDRVRNFSPYIQPRNLALAALGIGFSILQVDYYFNEHLVIYNEQMRESWGYRDAQDAILRSLHFPPGTQIHIITRTDPPNLEFMRGVLRFMVDGLELNILRTEDFTPAYLAELNRQVDHAFYVGPYNAAAITLMREHFTLHPPQLSPYDLPPDDQFILYYAPGSTNVAGGSQDDIGIAAPP